MMMKALSSRTYHVARCAAAASSSAAAGAAAPETVGRREGLANKGVRRSLASSSSNKWGAGCRSLWTRGGSTGSNVPPPQRRGGVDEQQLLRQAAHLHLCSSHLRHGARVEMAAVHSIASRSISSGRAAARQHGTKGDSAGAEQGGRGRGDGGGGETVDERSERMGMYLISAVIAFLGLSYAAVPLYKVFCQATGFGGTTQVADADQAALVKPVEGARLIRVVFDGGCADTMPWKFYPTQRDVKVLPGETALAFFTARNPSDKNITGVATYNVFPLKAGIYFNKIQCFCFEEQRLRSGEEIDMPVFFFLDPEMLSDPAMNNVTNITLSYTFFKTGDDRIGLDKKDLEEEEDEEEDEEEEGDEGKVGVAAAGGIRGAKGGALQAAAA